MTTKLNVYIDTRPFNGRVDAQYERMMGISADGCPYRGTSVCARCPLASRVGDICEYKCTRRSRKKGRPIVSCEHRAHCPCGWDQTERLRAWGLVK